MARLLIVDRQGPPQRSLTTALMRRPDIKVMGVATSVAEAMTRLSECDTLLVSAELPDDGALDLVRAAAEQDSWISVLVMDMGISSRRAAPYIDAGASGWVL